jgi:hypothetical protein
MKNLSVLKSLRVPLLMAPAFVLALLCGFSAPLWAQVDPGSGVFLQKQSPIKLSPEEGTLAFERDKIEFAPQSTGIENCVNMSLTNTTDHPRLLTELKSLDPKHFYVTSPAQGMLPLTIGSNSTFIINLCFRADEVKPYSTQLLAIFQTDTARLSILGRGVTPPEVVPIPRETSITEVRYKNRKWTFQFGLAKRSTIHLALENTLGKTVRNFPFEEVKTAGYYEVNFDGKSDAGKKIEKGGYILRLEATDMDKKTMSHSSKYVVIK